MPLENIVRRVLQSGGQVPVVMSRKAQDANGKPITVRVEGLVHVSHGKLRFVEKEEVNDQVR